MADTMITVKNVDKNYGNFEALKDVSMAVPTGQVYALIGPSGAGKSTLIRTINALEGIDNGSITVDGQSVHAKDAKVNGIRAGIGFVFQSFNLYPHLSAVDNVAVAPIHVKGMKKKAARERAQELLASLGLDDKFASFPNQLSGGQQQRVAIARALAMDPKVMLFDEPTSALDPEMIKEVLDAIRKLATTGMTMVVVTHEMGFAREICSQVVFMADAKVVEQAPPTTFFSAPKTARGQEFLEKVLHH